MDLGRVRAATGRDTPAGGEGWAKQAGPPSNFSLAPLQPPAPSRRPSRVPFGVTDFSVFLFFKFSRIVFPPSSSSLLLL